ncbi:hypothetical protein Y032_0052g2207 [Ancylostoma ceylanicum]|uniref:Uncharacterized protein n=1 Tax=Ancylostoma ceylanicum TaxID=53326 RepID=A0A016U860_9BILA|nr:hypothetical protein Y032_0052g2207 [Ancylostoma ceylanicum]
MNSRPNIFPNSIVYVSVCIHFCNICTDNIAHIYVCFIVCSCMFSCIANIFTGFCLPFAFICKTLRNLAEICFSITD